MPAKSFVILGCLSILIYVLNNRRPKPRKKPNDLLRTRSFIIREIHSGNPVLDRLIDDDFKQARVNPSALNNADKLLKEHLQQEFLDLISLQRNAAKLEMSAKEDEAEKILRDALKNATSKNKPQESYEIEMLLVEMLIYKGGKSDLEKALKCKCLEDDSLKDARRPLYKAIIYKMQGNTKEAENCWNEFIEVRDPTFHRPGEIHYKDFEHHVGRLQKAIQEVISNKRMCLSLFLSLVLYVFIALFSKPRKKFP
uniref:Uncharacterized protein n=1 Tax=Cajanus cajan TaxID=3821 RepID=A0A151RWC2_CAJCA|nr:hypothetical protein KK1_031551 [Cajanus cajan]